MIKGIVKFFNETKGFGFIKEEDYLKKDSILDKIDFFNTQTVN